MANHDPRIDAYFAKSAEFARPILEHLRERVHTACPEVEEGIKWGMPFFSYKAAPMCMMAAFKQHCSFGFWLSKEVTGGSDEDGMGQFGKLASLKDLPTDRQLATFLKKAMALNEAGVKKSRPKAAAKPAPTLPEDLATLLAQKKHAAARKTYEGFGPGAQREYVEWITEAKTDATRQKRLATTLEWLAEGKKRHWKYENC
ncbi:YdeI/OmpD-associated family protein [Rhodanobacter sp. FDAARGOS 1247]|uniref:YdeI/OmpD-associated family protein n=1 Tax=Rhodanobacter sp. FDAARGOS 1247 TaxID=2778082 RepID=UPI00194F3D02|nr:YdeI/OmpD-associated family protein [Rhodanobacter sp. FDAARGOS 1247]QRP65034.1 YdeI/OmpD-associated family protein [Rhodanobacter sp. FDAARGOS 1247]